MNSIISGGLAFLQGSVLDNFRDTTRYFWAPTGTAGSWQKLSTLVAGLPRLTAGSAGGLLQMQTGQRSWHGTAADFTRAPQEGDVFRWGPASGSSSTTPGDTCEQWRIVQLQPFGEQITIVAEPNG